MTDLTLSQAPVEVLVEPTPPDLELSQAAVEALVSPTPDLRLSQAAVEILVESGGAMRRWVNVNVSG